MKFLFLICAMIFVSCSQFETASRYRKNFTYCNKGEYTGLDTVINIKGVYLTTTISESYNNYYKAYRMDTLYDAIIFWADGTAGSIAGMAPNLYQSYFDKIIRKGRDNYFYKKSSWGNYRIAGDTIKVQYLYVPLFLSLNDSWSGVENCFRISKKNTLESLPMMSKALDRYYKDTPEAKENRKNAKKEIYTFVPVERIPPPNCWLKKKKWFWCNKEDWKEYKKRRK